MELSEAEQILNQNGFVLDETHRPGMPRLVINQQYEIMKAKALKSNPYDIPSQETLKKLGYTLVGDPYDGDYYYIKAKRNAKNSPFGPIFDNEIQIDVYACNARMSVEKFYKYLEKYAANKYFD